VTVQPSKDDPRQRRWKARQRVTLTEHLEQETKREGGQAAGAFPRELKYTSKSRAN